MTDNCTNMENFAITASQAVFVQQDPYKLKIELLDIVVTIERFFFVLIIPIAVPISIGLLPCLSLLIIAYHCLSLLIIALMLILKNHIIQCKYKELVKH